MWVITILYIDSEIQTERQPVPARAVLDTGNAIYTCVEMWRSVGFLARSLVAPDLVVLLPAASSPYSCVTAQVFLP